MKVLLFGSEGQLGQELVKRAAAVKVELICPRWTEVNITQRDQVLATAEQAQPELIINAAAYTAVDRAESERELAFAVNANGAKHIALAAKQCEARLIQVSTDYVFDGCGGEPLTEEAPVNPLSIYGASKLEGENAVLEILGTEKALVTRTASLHGKCGENFVHTMIKLFSTKPEVKVVQDQFSSPTWAGWLAETLLALRSFTSGGILHTSGQGGVSWYEFAATILATIRPAVEAAQKVRLEPCCLRDFPRPAPRPRYSVLNTTKLTKVLGKAPLTWQEGLAAHLAELGFKAQGSRD